MPEKTDPAPETISVSGNSPDSRVLPLAIAGAVCFTIAVILGYGSWYFFGSRNRHQIDQGGNTVAVLPTPEAIAAKTPETAQPPPTAENVNIEKSAETKIEGAVKVEGGEVTLGGGKTGKPLKRLIVDNFFIAETETTNAQYAEFIKATGHESPPGWEKEVFPKGTENYPVTNVSYQDATAYCEWLGKKLGVTVRLPSEAEWERAARGAGGNTYPWGNDWDGKAAISKETGGKISPVKSFPINQSAFGAFDMAGNVWEWTHDQVKKDETVTDEKVKQALNDGKVLRIVKGGSAREPAAQISAQARYEIPEKTKVPLVGFRYVIIR